MPCYKNNTRVIRKRGSQLCLHSDLAFPLYIILLFIHGGEPLQRGWGRGYLGKSFEKSFENPRRKYLEKSFENPRRKYLGKSFENPRRKYLGKSFENPRRKYLGKSFENPGGI